MSHFETFLCSNCLILGHMVYPINKYLTERYLCKLFKILSLLKGGTMNVLHRLGTIVFSASFLLLVIFSSNGCGYSSDNAIIQDEEGNTSLSSEQTVIDETDSFEQEINLVQDDVNQLSATAAQNSQLPDPSQLPDDIKDQLKARIATVLAHIDDIKARIDDFISQLDPNTQQQIIDRLNQLKDRLDAFAARLQELLDKII